MKRTWQIMQKKKKKKKKKTQGKLNLTLIDFLNQ